MKNTFNPDNKQHQDRIATNLEKLSLDDLREVSAGMYKVNTNGGGTPPIRRYTPPKPVYPVYVALPDSGVSTGYYYWW